MFTKTYFFLRNYIFNKLVDKLGYIFGNNVMHYFLCYKGKTMLFWYKVTKQAKIAFAKLKT